MKNFNECKIPTSEIKDDIQITQQELEQNKELLALYEKDRITNKLEILKAEVGISKREAFIQKLESILEYRKNNNIS